MTEFDALGHTQAYSVPALFFRATRLDGTPCSLREVLDNLGRHSSPSPSSSSSAEASAEASAEGTAGRGDGGDGGDGGDDGDGGDGLRTVVAQEVHPNLGLPFVLVHPCRTREWMAHLALRASDGAAAGAGVSEGEGEGRVGEERGGRTEALYLLSWLGVAGALLGDGAPPPPELHAAARAALLC